ncbi:DNA primase [Lysinibacillus sphaericus]|uniref:DNA primase n=1 Tax=Lysinibacillus sphaericus TaxID=1421 RepID=UPI0018CFB38C|nr:toprim domain-containing protein [Lysinibacillus sphaericus]
MDFKKAMHHINDLYQFALLHTEEGESGLNYLKERGFTDETIQKFGYGRTTPKDKLTESLLKSEAEHIKNFVEWGLVREKENGSIQDFFKGRLMIPIHDDKGALVGFAGRTLPHNTHPAKYLNSPENDYFKKREVLYNFYQAKKSIVEKNYAVLMEGYFDVAMAVQNGMENVIGTMGTALTIENIARLKTVTNNIIIMFDGDIAGMESARSNATLLQEQGFNVRIAMVPNEYDPHELLLYMGKELFDHILMSALTVMNFTIHYLQKKYDLSNESNRMQYVGEILDTLKHESLEYQREVFVWLCNTCGFNYEHANYYLQQAY